MEGGRWEGQNFQPLKEIQRLKEEEEEEAYHLEMLPKDLNVRCIFEDFIAVGW
jgi:hypothetical protein